MTQSHQPTGPAQVEWEGSEVVGAEMRSGLMPGKAVLDGESISWLLPRTSGVQSQVRPISTLLAAAC